MGLSNTVRVYTTALFILIPDWCKQAKQTIAILLFKIIVVLFSYNDINT